VNVPRTVTRVEIDEVAAQIRATMMNSPAPGSCHNDTCKQKKIRHSYMIRVAGGWLTHDGLTENQRDAEKYTKKERDIIIASHVGGYEIFRVIR